MGDARAAVAAVVEHEPDVALLDIHMPGNGISAAHRISHEVPGTAIVMLTVSQNDEDLFAALRAGAAGYLLKDTDPDRLPIALNGVLNGEAALPRTLVARLMDQFRGDLGRRPRTFGSDGRTRLTSREHEILEMLRQGLSTKEIGERLFVSPVTVRTHVSSLLKKLKVPDRASAVRLIEEEQST